MRSAKRFWMYDSSLIESTSSKKESGGLYGRGSAFGSERKGARIDWTVAPGLFADAARGFANRGCQSSTLMPLIGEAASGIHPCSNRKGNRFMPSARACDEPVRS